MADAAVKIGLIGLGNMGRNHLRVLSLLKKVDLQFVYDADLARAKELAAQFGTVAVSSVEEGFAKKPDAVVICTPTSTHADYIRRASEHVCNIFVEKPMAATLAQAEKIAALVKEKNLHLQVGFIERFNPAVQQLKNVLAQSKKVVNIDFTRTNRISARIIDVDVISDLMIHDIDLALYLNGPVKSVSAQGAVEDKLVNFASAIVTHENGKFSRIVASRITEKKIRKIEATCDDVFVDCDLLRKEIVASRQSEIHNATGGYTISAVQENIEVKPQEALLLELQSFVDSCLGVKTQGAPSAADALAALRVCHQIQSGIYK